jgi:hypothetical protein
MLISRDIALDLSGEGSMLVQLLAALVGDAVFGSITSRQRRFNAEMLRYLEARGLVPPSDPTPPQK